ncbi:MAG: hypothetical protein COX65_05335 [Elusimicrobia bacterium CG_4_10_14_0_2_um_filter_56_8]|nr:MAG: hypothetical protein AUJ51_03900 [Elusimicrobia bacterium CG1_02_56_21]PJA14673.1 MAG: hypothetical protein COX65_05335 [Elusimicrobia bacterium CG_4_10_14_0_2_um_filter_56_8]
MKKIIIAVTMIAGMGLNSAAYFDGGVTGTTGPDYSGYKLDLRIGSGDFALEPSLTTYKYDNAALGNKTYRTYGLRGAWEKETYTVGAEAGTTPEVNGYKNVYAGGDITFSLTPASGGKSRLAGPGARSVSGGGEGVARVDIGASLKQTQHTNTAGASDLKTSQTAASLFAGAKVLMLNLSASFTGYTYGSEDALPQDFVPGLNFAVIAKPKSSVTARVDIPSTIPMITPFAGYTTTKYKGAKDSSAILLGGYVDLNMVVANVAYQIFDNGSTSKNFVSIGAGIKF